MKSNGSLEDSTAECPSRADLYAFRSGELPEDALQRVAAHVSACARCAATLREIDEKDEVLLAKFEGSGGTKPFLDEPECAELITRARALVNDLIPCTVVHSRPAPLEPLEELFPFPFGKYHLLHRINAGAMGVVYKAHDLTLGRIVALKMMRAGSLASPRQLQRFKIEARAMARLDHPHIVPIYEDGEHQGQSFFTMKFMSGGSLAEHLPRFSADLRRAVEALIQVARAIAYLHERRLLHRDLKPSNILLDEHDVAHVSDFGLAKFLDAELEFSQTGEVVGSLPYISPEQAIGQPDRFSPATDLWSLGVILYELLTGQRPFRGQTREELLRQIAAARPRPPRKLRPQLPQALEQICLKCLEKDPSERYPSACLLAEHLEAWLQGKPVRVPRQGLLSKTRATVRRRPFLVFSPVLVGLVCFALYGAISAFLPKGNEEPGASTGTGTPQEWKEPADEAALAELQRELRERRSVTLIPATGRPRWWKWQVNPVVPGRNRDQPFFFRTLGSTLMELLPSVPGRYFRVSAEVQHVLDAGAEVGIYFGHSKRQTPHGVQHSFYKLSVNDLRDVTKEKEFAELKGNQMSLQVTLGYELENQGLKMQNRAAGMDLIYRAAGRVKPMPWRSIGVEVRSTGVRIFWNDTKPLKPLAWVDLKKKVERSIAANPVPDPGRPPFEPNLGLGLYLFNAAAAFKNVKVELLDD
jgi:tRNA A-37 threonylcarbamoyl transferase component Bud32